MEPSVLHAYFSALIRQPQYPLLIGKIRAGPLMTRAFAAAGASLRVRARRGPRKGAKPRSGRGAGRVFRVNTMIYVVRRCRFAAAPGCDRTLTCAAGPPLWHYIAL